MKPSKYSNPNLRLAGSSPVTRDIAARADANNRFALANADRDCAKAIGEKWPVEDSEAQRAIVAEYDRAAASGRGIVDKDAHARVQAAMARLMADGWRNEGGNDAA